MRIAMSVKRATGFVSVAIALLIFAVAPAPRANAQRENEVKNQAKKAGEAKPEPKKEGEDKDKKPEQGMQYRSIGPFRGGRSLTAAGVPGNPNVYYFGGTGGGVFKSTDGALTWKPVFDHEGSLLIRALAVATSDPDVIY